VPALPCLVSPSGSTDLLLFGIARRVMMSTPGTGSLPCLPDAPGSGWPRGRRSLTFIRDILPPALKVMVSLSNGVARVGRIDRRRREATSRLNASLYACHHQLVNGHRSQLLRCPRTDARKTAPRTYRRQATTVGNNASVCFRLLRAAGGLP